MSAATATTRQAPASRGCWTHHIPDSFFNRPDLDPGLEHLAIRFERLAREKPCFVTSNEELMAQLGCSRNTLAAALRRGEQKGWFRRVLVPGRHGRATGRLGIVLFIRCTDRPVATPETFDQVVERMKAEGARGRARPRPRTLPFPSPIPQESGTAVPRNWAPPVPKNWAPSVPRNWAPSSSSKREEETQETTTTETDSGGSSSSSPLPLDPGPESAADRHPAVEVLEQVTVPTAPVADATTQSVADPPAPVATPPAPAEAPAAAAVPAELVGAAAQAIPGASREWLAGLLRACGAYGLDLALLVLAWVKARRPQKPMRYAQVALSGWLNKLQAGVMTLDDVRAEVEGETDPRASPRPFDPAICLARLACDGWTIVAEGPDRVRRQEIPGRDASLWRHVPSELRQQIEEHKAELKAYVLSRASERGKAVALRA